MAIVVVSEDIDHLPPDALHDFEIECEEHVFAARQTLLSLDTVPDLALVGQEPLDVLFRAFHTIKGLAGMVGAQSTEQAAHQVEAILSAIRKGALPLSEEAVDLLLDSVSLLEASCAAFVRGESAIDTDVLIQRTAMLLSTQISDAVPQDAAPKPEGSSSKPSHQERDARIEAAVMHGKRVWKLIFAPSSELAAQGINVSTIRDKLRTIGDIIDAEPISTPGGVQFQFLVSTSAVIDPAISLGDSVAVAAYEPMLRNRPSTPTPTVPGGGSKLVRVELSRLDDLMRSVAELVITRGRLQGGLLRARPYLPARERRKLEETTESIEQQLRQLREGIMRVRMVPVRDLFARMRLVVRDLTRQSGKRLELIFEGEETEVDKLLVERMADPLLHLIRNAVSHGIEDEVDRVAAGKAPQGKITVRAGAVGGMIVLEVEDDGRGVQVEEVFAQAKRRGVISPSTIPDATGVLDLLCTPGFSTRDEADHLSGRGVGMDIVRLTVETLGGTVALESRPGAGSRFSCRMPLTLMVSDVLTVAAGGQTYAVAKTLIQEVVPVVESSITVAENHELIPYRSGVLPLLRLSDLFKIPRSSGEFAALITGEGSSAVAFGIDRAMGLHEVVVRALVDPLVQVMGVSGATDLGDGHPVLILDPVGLTRIARQRQGIRASTSKGE